MRKPSDKLKVVRPSGDEATERAVPNLQASETDLTILRMVLDGHSCRDIARTLAMREAHVETVIRSALMQLIRR